MFANQNLRSLCVLFFTHTNIPIFMRRLLSTKYSNSAFNIALLILRLTGGVLIIPHGYSKLKAFSKLSSSFADPFHMGSMTSLSLVIFAEFFCGILIVLGLLTRLACVPLIIAMAVALVYANHSDVFGKGEAPALFLGIFLTILFVGPGKASVDGMIGK